MKLGPAVIAHRRWVLWFAITMIVLTAVLGWYTVTTIGMNSDTAGMISRDLPFRRLWDQYKTKFPHDNDTLVIVLDGTNSDNVEDSALRLARGLRERSQLFRNVFYPGGEEYFRRNGLLYLSEAELAELTDRLAAAQPLFATLSGDPSLRGLFAMLGEAVDRIKIDDGSSNRISDAFEKISAVIEHRAQGKSTSLSWSDVLKDREAKPSERRRILVVNPRLDYTTIPPGELPMRAVRTLARELGIAPEKNGVRVRLTGSVALETEELYSVETGAGRAGLLSLAMVGLLLAVGLRSWRLVAAVLGTLIVGLIWTAAFASAAVGRLNLISVAFIVLFIGLAVDFGIHFSLRFREEIDQGRVVPDALVAAIRGVGGSLALTAISAAIAFLSFAATDYRGIAELGIISAAGMVIALVLNLTLLPAILVLLPPKPGRKGKERRWQVMSAYVRQHARAICIIAALLGFGSLPLLTQVQFESNPFNLKDIGTESVQTMLELVQDPDAAPYTASVIAPNMAAAERLAERLKSLPLVDKVATVRDLVPAGQNQKLAMIDEMALLLGPAVDTTEIKPAPTTAQRRLSYEQLHKKLKARLASEETGSPTPSISRLAAALAAFEAKRGLSGPSLAALERALTDTLPGALTKVRLALRAEKVALADIPKSLRERYVSADGRIRVEIFPNQDITDMRRLRAFVEQIRTVTPNVTHVPINILDGGDVVISAFQRATATALIAILILIAAFLRRIREAILVLCPLILAAVLTVAIGHLVGVSFNLANIIVLPLLLGLGLASGIHLVRRARIESQSEMLHSSTPRAVLFSALTTLSSFGTLMLSNHRGTASMGELLTIAIAMALLSSLVVLPAMMAVWRE